MAPLPPAELVSESAIIEEFRHQHSNFFKIQSLYNETDGILHDISKNYESFASIEDHFLDGGNDNVNTIAIASMERENTQRILFFLSRLLKDTEISQTLLNSVNMSPKSLFSGESRSTLLEYISLLKQLFSWKPPTESEDTFVVRKFFKDLSFIRFKFAALIHECVRTVLEETFPSLSTHNSSSLLQDAHNVLSSYSSLLTQLRWLDDKSVLPLLDTYSKLCSTIVRKRLLSKFPITDSTSTKSKKGGLVMAKGGLLKSYDEFCMLICQEISSEHSWFSSFFDLDTSSDHIITSHLLLAFDVCKEILSAFTNSVVTDDSKDTLINSPMVVNFLSRTESFMANYQDSVNAIAAILAQPQLLLSQTFNQLLEKYVASIKSHRISTKKVGIVSPSQELPRLIYSLAVNHGGTAKSALSSIFDSFSKWLMTSTDCNRSCRIDNVAFLAVELRKGYSDDFNSAVLKFIEHFDVLLKKELDSYIESLLCSTIFGKVQNFSSHANRLLSEIHNSELRYQFGCSFIEILELKMPF
ncbi:hypothetical protein GEMRC1_011582 [Eukaryota sp. GEM-RC1]